MLNYITAFCLVLCLVLLVFYICIIYISYLIIYTPIYQKKINEKKEDENNDDDKETNKTYFIRKEILIMTITKFYHFANIFMLFYITWTSCIKPINNKEKI